MIDKQKLSWVYGGNILFIAINALFIAYEHYWFSLLPLLIGLLLLYFFSLDKILLLIVFATPLAVNIEFDNLGSAISIPTEPLMAGVLVLFIIKLLFDFKINKALLKHPVTITIIFYLIWILFTSITSEYPLVSFKFFIVKLWFIIPFYILGVQLFKKHKNIRTFAWLYIIALLIVVTYTIIHHSQWDFREDPAHWVMSPFYKDHTSYGALLAMFLPVSISFIFDKHYNKSIKLAAAFVTLILIIALILSYSRAAWLSVAFALAVMIIILLRFRFRYILLIFGVFAALFFSLQHEIVSKLEKNKQDSSADFVEHVQSIYNISSDASNLERINRWQAAFRMFNERPFLGWGPGTYQFIYAPYQHSKEKTIISTNAGDKGNAHSEYIGPLAEAGVFGLLTFFAIIVAVVYTGIKVFRKSINIENSRLSLVFLISLMTYYLHGFLNNFLDTDKASVPFWGFTAIIVALDIYHKNNDNEIDKKVKN